MEIKIEREQQNKINNEKNMEIDNEENAEINNEENAEINNEENAEIITEDTIDNSFIEEMRYKIVLNNNGKKYIIDQPVYNKTLQDSIKKNFKSFLR